MPKTERTEVFDVNIDDFYNVLLDYESYPDFVDGVSGINVLEKDESGARVEYSLNMIKKFVYVLKLTHDRPKSLSWTLESGDLFKKSEGSWSLKDLGDGKTEVTYSVDIDFKGFAPKMVINKLVSGSLPTMMQSYLKRAQG
ncbi:MAG: coenzyme Q-binding protein COQ10 [Parvicellaceae bacterium]|jgi:coenzyme Q-binding protein COQ10